MNIEELDCYNVGKEDLRDLKKLLSELIRLKSPADSKIDSLEKVNERLTLELKEAKELILKDRKIMHNVSVIIDKFLELFQKENFNRNDMEVIQTVIKMKETKENLHTIGYKGIEWIIDNE